MHLSLGNVHIHDVRTHTTRNGTVEMSGLIDLDNDGIPSRYVHGSGRNTRYATARLRDNAIAAFSSL
jgi:hypothetical protein